MSGSQAQEVDIAEALVDLRAEVAALREDVGDLGRIVTMPDVQLPKGLKRAVFNGTPAAALKARVGKAAKRNGMSLADWRAQYGDRTTNP